MWVALEAWLLGDGQIPELEPGAVVRDCGLRLHASSLAASEESHEELSPGRTDGRGRVRYDVTGRCWSVTSPMAALIAMPGWLAITEPESHRDVAGSVDLPALEPWSENFRPPGPTQMLRAEGWFGVVPEHEWDAFPIPDSRMDWRLRAIRLVENHVVPMLGEGTDGRSLGGVSRSTRVDRLSLAADGIAGAWFLVDLEPA